MRLAVRGLGWLFALAVPVALTRAGYETGGIAPAMAGLGLGGFFLVPLVPSE
jgi:hypothetical protein